MESLGLACVDMPLECIDLVESDAPLAIGAAALEEEEDDEATASAAAAI